jgi:thioredoxin-dependent peroxiredoxin
MECRRKNRYTEWVGQRIVLICASRRRSMSRELNRFVFTLLVAALIGLPIGAAEEGSDTEEAPKPLAVGDAAPDFKFPVKGEDGETKTMKLSELKGKNSAIVAFYPKAFTPGCTKQLCGYRDDYAKLQSKDTVVIAVSFDKQDYSEKFKAEYEMPFHVVGDRDGKIVEAYRVPYRGRGKFKFAKRSVFLVGKDGKLKYVDHDYKVGDDKGSLYDVLGITLAELQPDEEPKHAEE